MKNQTTSKKVKIIGTVPKIDPYTGEIEEYYLTDIEEKDFNFTKVWMKNFVATLDLVGNQKTKFAYWLINQITKENIIPMTYRIMADKSGISLGTVRDTMGVLLDAGFLKRISIGCYIVNPDILFKGTRTARLNIINRYHDAEYVPLSDEQRLTNLVNSISQLQKQAELLANKIQQEKGVMTDAKVYTRTDAESPKNEPLSILTSKSC